jgi:hypothetical protein
VNDLQLPLDFARAASRRDHGIKRSADHADRATPEWQERAVGYVRRYATVHRELLCEHVRAMAEVDGFTAPTDPRAWGGAMRLAAKRGIIEPNGYAPAVSSNLSPKRYWKSLIQERVA